jgi:hypothetical protein
MKWNALRNSAKINAYSNFHYYGSARIGNPHALCLMDQKEPNLGKEKEILFVCLFVC